MVVDDGLGHVDQAEALGHDQLLQAGLVHGALGRQALDDARADHDHLAELRLLERDLVVHVPQEAGRLAGERAVAVGRHGARAAHANVEVAAQRLREQLERVAGDEQVRADEADRVDLGVAVREISIDRRDFAVPYRLFDQTNRDAGLALALPNDVNRAVLASAGNDDDLDDVDAKRFLTPQRINQQPYVSFFVEGRYRDANSHKGCASRLRVGESK
jgi:hypothetical protein